MKKIVNGMLCVAALGLTLGLGACNNEKCCGTCKDKAVMKDGSVDEASAKSCSKSCADKKSCEGKKCCGTCGGKCGGAKN